MEEDRAACLCSALAGGNDVNQAAVAAALWPECLDFGPLPGGRGGDEAAAFGHLGLAVEYGNQRSVFQLPRDQHGASDGGPEPVDRGLDQRAVEAEAGGTSWSPRQFEAQVTLADNNK